MESISTSSEVRVDKLFWGARRDKHSRDRIRGLRRRLRNLRSEIRTIAASRSKDRHVELSRALWKATFTVRNLEQAVSRLAQEHAYLRQHVAHVADLAENPFRKRELIDAARTMGSMVAQDGDGRCLVCGEVAICARTCAIVLMEQVEAALEGRSLGQTSLADVAWLLRRTLSHPIYPETLPDPETERGKT